MDQITVCDGKRVARSDKPTGLSTNVAVLVHSHLSHQPVFSSSRQPISVKHADEPTLHSLLSTKQQAGKDGN